MNKKSDKKISTHEQRLQSAKIAAYKRMQARQKHFQKNMSAEEIIFNEGFSNEFRKTFRDDASGDLLNSIKNNFTEFNDWIKKQTGGLLDLNMSLAIFFIIRGIRRLVLEKQTPNAWQMIWWAMSILRGWRFV